MFGGCLSRWPCACHGGYIILPLVSYTLSINLIMCACSCSMEDGRPAGRSSTLQYLLFTPFHDVCLSVCAQHGEWSFGVCASSFGRASFILPTLLPLCACSCTCSMEDGHLVYVRESKQETLLLMHLLVVALDLEGWRMGPTQFELLRRELKTTPADVVNRYAENALCPRHVSVHLCTLHYRYMYHNNGYPCAKADPRSWNCWSD